VDVHVVEGRGDLAARGDEIARGEDRLALGQEEVVQQLGGTANFDWRPVGLRFVMSAPIGVEMAGAVVAIPATKACAAIDAVRSPRSS